MTRKLIRQPSFIINVLYFCQTCIILVDSLHADSVDECDLENDHLIIVYAYFSFQKWRKKICVYLVPANRSGHKIREIGGSRYKSRFFFSKTRRSTYILTFNISTVQDGSLQRYMVCLSEFVVKNAVTKYAIKNYISKSMVVTRHFIGCILPGIPQPLSFNRDVVQIWEFHRNVVRMM